MRPGDAPDPVLGGGLGPCSTPRLTKQQKNRIWLPLTLGNHLGYMHTVSAERFLLDQIPIVHRALIPTTLKTAYSAARVMAKNEPILQVPSAENNRGRLISWAVDFGFERLIKTGQWPVDYRWRNFAKPTGRYLEIRLSHSVLSISQISNPKQQPRDVVFRENARLENRQFTLFPELEEDREISGLPHFLLVHGYQDLSFAHITVPHVDHGRGYLYRTPNLMMMPHAVPADEPLPEDTDAEAIITLKEEIEKWQRDHGG
jgi:hypothetical protein